VLAAAPVLVSAPLLWLASLVPVVALVVSSPVLLVSGAWVLLVSLSVPDAAVPVGEKQPAESISDSVGLRMPGSRQRIRRLMGGACDVAPSVADEASAELAQGRTSAPVHGWNFPGDASARGPQGTRTSQRSAATSRVRIEVAWYS
jgi:hypothetical protein